VTDNLKIWNALGKTDPAHTKGFSRAGGFKGTSVKPMWVLHRLTEEFGPAGIGWGVNEPQFQVVAGEGEILVYCTVSAWHGKRENVLWGVGGDKVLTKRSSGPFHDDEAFKKAFTDAVNNAFKSVGVAADIHMGLFDDDKYVASMREEFADEPEVPEIVAAFLNGLRDAYAQGNPEEYWKANWPGVPLDWRPYALEQKEQIKAAQGKVAMLRAG
jgi:uncharacterized short protein YbdD (DUF466 family)